MYSRLGWIGADVNLLDSEDMFFSFRIRAEVERVIARDGKVWFVERFLIFVCNAFEAIERDAKVEGKRERKKEENVEVLHFELEY